MTTVYRSSKQEGRGNPPFLYINNNKFSNPNLEAMPIEEVKMYGAICECCKESWYNDYHGWSAMNDESSLKKILLNDDWHLEDGKTYCPSCYEIDDDDNLKIKVN